MVWDTAPLLSLCKAYQPKTIGRKEMDPEGTYPVYGANGIIGRYHSANHTEPELVIGCRGSCGVVNVTEGEAWITGNAMVLKPLDDRLDRDFLRHFLADPSILANVITGVAQPQITRKSLSAVQIPIPPLAEQRRIVATLDEAFAGIATATANAEKNLANARELFDAFRSACMNDENWPRRELGDIATNLDRLRQPITKKDRQAGSIPYYGASGQVDSVRDHIFDEDLLLVSEDGANLLARTYPIAFSISGKSWVNNHAHVLRFEHMETQKFVEAYLNGISLEPYVSGMAQPKLNQKQLNLIPIPLPDLDEQRDIVERLSELAGYVEELVSIYTAKADSLSNLKRTFLTKAFSGELTNIERAAAA
ncbi:restriction endonuclease subunit S [Qipengyuania sp. 1NDH17]|uniref:Restriction endonuclease subunit S n=1 Tax=Qipengyuania polymorpha TaxID=2867234 RepID=A0ABS7IWW6_9SPHN|nr:restriction endonuclease subunit S [Qipengyuania polymorpha]MBX7456656.1 restriction endonuclease subunit S [Qipengyuania polymorpha]